MLGWMLKRGESAPDSGDGDTTQIDQPDTPAPVFAARAFKSALFGTPSKRAQDRRANPPSTKRTSETPSKPQGILLTPGTGTSKRKRVSFGRDVPGGSVTTLDRITELDEATETEPTAASTNNNNNNNNKAEAATVTKDAHISDDEWEEEDEDGYSSHDVTVDLNEPHSQSGRYWKEEFLKYHQEARAEMEKLLKYKQLAKSYAQQKDAEAIQLAERLRDEQQRVIKMEKKIAENASQIVTRQRESSGQEPMELLGKLTKQTTLAAQYRHRVQELEAQMGELHAQRDSAAGSETPRRRYASTPSVTATQKTLTETRRELRRARSQLKELDSLRDEVFRLKIQLKKAELRLVVNEKEDGRACGGPRAQELRTLLQAARDESQRKDDQLGQLQAEFEAYRTESDARDADTKAVLARAHTKIAGLKKEVKTLRASGSAQARPHGWQPDAAKEDIVKEAKSDELLRDKLPTTERRSLDETAGMARKRVQSRNLREKFVEDAALAPSRPGDPTAAERARLDKPKWQPFVPRSPRNRGYLPDDVASRVKGSRPKEIAAPELPALTKTTKRDGNAAAAEAGSIDLLTDRFARLGGPGPNGHINSSMVGNTSKGTLPPDRRAAALARIETRMAEKKKLRDRGVSDKENVRP